MNKSNDTICMDAKLKEQLKRLNLDFDHIRDESTRDDVSLLLNGVEQFSDENDHLKEENQRLKDEMNRLKGEQGQPKIRAGKKNTDISSEQERKPKTQWWPSYKRRENWVSTSLIISMIESA